MGEGHSMHPSILEGYSEKKVGEHWIRLYDNMYRRVPQLGHETSCSNQ